MYSSKARYTQIHVLKSPLYRHKTWDSATVGLVSFFLQASIGIALVSHHHVHASHGAMVFLSLVPSPLQVQFHCWNDHPRLFIPRPVLLAVRRIGTLPTRDRKREREREIGSVVGMEWNLNVNISKPSEPSFFLKIIHKAISFLSSKLYFKKMSPARQMHISFQQKSSHHCFL